MVSLRGRTIPRRGRCAVWSGGGLLQRLNLRQDLCVVAGEVVPQEGSSVCSMRAARSSARAVSMPMSAVIRHLKRCLVWAVRVSHDRSIGRGHATH